MWESVVEFSEHADARLVFGTNGNLDLANVAKFLEIAQDNISILEVGNEMYTTNGSTPEKCTDMQASLGASLSARFPDLNLAGPDSGPTAIHADYLDKLLLANGNRSDVLYAATVHHYPLDGHVTTDDPTYFPPSAFVNVESVERWRLELNANGFNSTQLWIGEGGGQSSGGQPGSTDSFASGQWYLDSLGAYARGGVDVFCRQDLVGANYGLLEDGCPYGGLSDVNPVCDPAVQPEPLPDYWNALLWKRIMGPKPLEVGVEFASDNNDDNASYFLRAYAHFSSDNSTIGVLLINTDVDRPANVSIELRSGGNERLSQDYERLRRKTNSEGSYPSRATHDRVDWHLTSENKSSSVSFLNGVKLALRKDDNGWKLPSLDGVPANLNDPIIIAPQSYSFFAFSR
ncbi:hypothetical protein CTAYLR_005278 [Chrysophaeum taylorii]|uniref:Beta-glucuronidase C-terminal domain-containing protein n=1 Tax=Chrysophaeum taylorii TaxID=2483200 RepID=A0AAD7ULM5_9STRA|nr:hypothetical protein CTAYLR_005278 [Chrysophaeum taylorii]